MAMDGVPWVVPVCFLFCVIEVGAVTELADSLAFGAGARRSEKNVCKVLQSHGLPVGLLPEGVTDFLIDERSGRFEAHPDRPCTARFENELHYDCNVTGTISYGRMGALSGILARELFLWFPVRGIRVDIPSSGLIYFDVGVIYKQFPLSLFENPPKCRDSIAVGDSKSSLRMGDFFPLFRGGFL